MLLLALFWLCQVDGSSSKDASKVVFTNQRPILYGPSYRPRWLEKNMNLRSAHFCYEGPCGVIEWPLFFPDCGLHHQSPINIDSDHLILKKTKKPLKWVNYAKIPKTMTLENSGHSIHATGSWASNYTPFITNGPLKHNYYFSQLHFHWGIPHSQQGSEHTVNNQSFPIEMHVVHDTLPKPPPNVAEDSSHPKDYLVVVSYMFELDEEDNPALTSILEGSKYVKGNQIKKTNIRPFPLNELVEAFQGDYVTYRGSLTTPPCREGVLWIINSKPVGISKHQLSTLRHSVTDESHQLIQNFRPVQPLNGRKVYYVFC